MRKQITKKKCARTGCGRQVANGWIDWGAEGVEQGHFDVGELALRGKAGPSCTVAGYFFLALAAYLQTRRTTKYLF